MEVRLQSTRGHSGQLAVRAYDDYLGHSLTVVVYNASLFHEDYSFPIPTPDTCTLHIVALFPLIR